MRSLGNLPPAGVWLIEKKMSYCTGRSSEALHILHDVRFFDHRAVLALSALALGGCAARAPLPAASWESSLRARPDGVVGGTEVAAATPSEPGDLYEVTAEERIDEPVVAGVLACRVRVTGDLRGLASTPDRIVELSIRDRTSVFARSDSTEWDFSVGLVDLAIGDPVGLRVTDDRLGDNRVLVQGDRLYDGGPLGWTERRYGVRTSVRCRIPRPRELQRELARRLRALDDDVVSVRRVAAITGWSDPRVQRAQMERSRPPSTATD